MKKVLFVLLALCLFVVPVMAQESPDNPVVTNWEGDLEDSFIEKEYAGKFYLFADYGLQFLVPSDPVPFEPQDLTEEDAEHGVFAVFMTADEKNQILASFLNYGVETLEEVAMIEKENRGDNMKFGGYYQFNGLNAILFMDTNSDVLVAVISTTAEGQYIKIALSSISDENVNAVSGYIMGSIQPYSAE